MGSETEEFAALLRELKSRSGRSYGTLAAKLHMSTSTVHRYCNGDAVPTEYAPVERFARLCGANPDELIALHRRWLLADAARRRPKDTAAPRAAEAAQEPGPGPEGAQEPEGEAVPETAPASAPASGPAPAPEAAPETVPAPDPGPTPRKGRRLWLAGAAVVAVAVAVPVSVAVSNAGSASPDHRASAGVSHGAPHTDSPTGTPGATATKRPEQSPDPSASTTPSPSGSHRASDDGGALGADGRSVPAVPLTVNVRPYVWDSPCSQSYLVDRPAAKMPPPPAEQDAASWAAALGGVSSGGARIELSVQGKTSDAVVLQALHVRIVERHAPLAWASYAMGDGCGGGLTPAGFDVNLDTGTPLADPVAGVQGDRKVPATDFPYRVSTTDPQVLEINARTAAHDVSWYLELQWSSGSRHGTIRIDDHGRPFRASSAEGRPRYVHPLGGDAWEPPLQ
ncbi:helix-turn-helix domain-containing protein [Streptomyces sp. NBC_01023]|uniref:helix-turn-helix domain-containing protein n=1 Tax=Streptomyces sp. NBC_00466 TaxID=2903655 RepID=UPI0030E24610|nr:helix-turn-helix domain-containing protein [Streptomyces sp. NBC_01023]